MESSHLLRQEVHVSHLHSWESCYFLHKEPWYDYYLRESYCHCILSQLSALAFRLYLESSPLDAPFTALAMYVYIRTCGVVANIFSRRLLWYSHFWLKVHAVLSISNRRHSYLIISNKSQKIVFRSFAFLFMVLKTGLHSNPPMQFTRIVVFFRYFRCLERSWSAHTGLVVSTYWFEEEDIIIGFL